MTPILSVCLTLLLAADAPAPAPAAPAQPEAAAPAAPAAPGAPAVPAGPEQGGAQPANQPLEAPADQGPGMGQMLWPIIIMLVVMWFLVMRPQKKYQRERQAMLSAMKKRDLVVTRGGIIGTVVELKPERDEVLLEISKNVRVRIRRAAVEGVLPPEEGEPSKE